jgi:hypothetical protein
LLQPADHQEEQQIAAAIDVAYDHDVAFRRLRHFRELLAGHRRPQAGDLAARLRPWIEDGPHAWLFDNPADALDLGRRVLGFDMTRLLDDPALRTPAMMYLFHRVDERLDGTPAMIVIDEGWKALDDPVFTATIRDWLKTLRKRNAIVGFGTQSARDALDSRIGPAIVEQAATQIFMPNAKAQAQDYCEGFGLSAHELDLIRALPVSSHAFLVRHAHHSVVIRLDLGGMSAVLTALSGREASVRRLDDLRAIHGDDPALWYEPLTGQPGQARCTDERLLRLSGRWHNLHRPDIVLCGLSERAGGGNRLWSPVRPAWRAGAGDDPGADGLCGAVRPGPAQRSRRDAAGQPDAAHAPDRTGADAGHLMGSLSACRLDPAEPRPDEIAGILWGRRAVQPISSRPGLTGCSR